MCFKIRFLLHQVSADNSIQPSQRRARAQGEGSKEGDVEEPDRRQVQDDPEADRDNADEEEAAAIALPRSVLQQRPLPRAEPQSGTSICWQRRS